MRAECPKCSGVSTHFEKTAYDLILRCTCGFSKVVFTILKDSEDMTVSKRTVPVEVKLPRGGTHLRKTLLVLECLQEASTAEITERLLDLRGEYSTSDVASYLAMLRAKKLVLAPVIRRGVTGGSTWVLSPLASSLLGLPT
jgi:hypothetical protein